MRYLLDHKAQHHKALKVALISGRPDGINPFIPAFRLLLSAIPFALAVVLLGSAITALTHEAWYASQPLIQLIGEGMMLVGALMMTFSCGRAWLLVFESAGYLGNRHGK